jgi:hypothetical protein
MRTVVVAAVATSALALGAPAPAAARACWQQVVTDWTDGHIDRVYAPRCYRDAIRHLPEDLRSYSSAADDISRALLQSTDARRGSDVLDRRLAAAGPPRPRTSSFPVAAVIVGGLGSIVSLLGAVCVVLVVRRRRAG